VLRDLIYDVGMHDGTDTSHFLARGFRVVAIEANPEFVEQAGEQFADAVAARRLQLLNVAIFEQDGTTEFFVCRRPETMWSTLDEAVMRTRTAESNAVFEPIRIPCRRFEGILDDHGVPYYLKIDIEGSDVMCLRALYGLRSKPAYVSVEITREHAYEDIAHLLALGYTRFKLLDQRLHDDIHASGPFGEDTPGRWIPGAEVLRQYRAALGAVGREPWFDLHAKHERAGGFARAASWATSRLGAGAR
jgi:FkbM family methyltransferase